MAMEKYGGWTLFKTKIATITGPSGTGKTSIVRKLLELDPSLGLVVSLTTRDERDTDLEGEYLCRRSKEELLLYSSRGMVLWVEPAHTDYYCTLKKNVDSALEREAPSAMILIPKVIPILRDYALLNGAGVQSFFILPPAEGELRRRIRQRKDSDEHAIKIRIAECRRWEYDAGKSVIPYVFIENPVTDPPDIGITRAAVQILEYSNAAK